MRVADGELVQRAPHPVVGARPGEVVAGAGAGRLLVRDHRLEDGGGAVDDRGVEGAGDHDDAGSVGQGAHELRLRLAASLRRPGPLPEPVAVDRDVLADVVRERVVGGVGRPLDEGPEVIEVAVVRGEPDAGRAWGRVVVMGAPSFVGTRVRSSRLSG